MAIYSDSGYITGVDFPLIRPTLDLNFAATKTLDRRITFTRDSIGTYADELGIVRYASNNVPRFDHDPTTGESLGLLIEESRTNLFTYSEDYTQSDWFKGRIGITANATTSPDDTQTADLLTENNTSTGEHYIGQVGFNYTSGQSYTWSWYVKPNGRTNVYCKVYTNFNTANAILNLDTGTVYHVSAEQFDSTTYERLSNGWYRVSFTKTAISTGEGNVLLGFANSSTTYAYLGDGTSGMYYWGAQVEAGSFATSYIPTSGSTVTRNKDMAVIKGTNFTDLFNTSFKELSLFVDYDNSQTDDGTYYEIVSFWGESAGFDDRIGISKDNDSPYHIETRAFGGGSGIFANDNLSASSKAASQKFATSWSVPDYSNTTSRRWAFCFSGETPVDVVNDGSGSSVPAITRLGIGISPTRLQETETGGLIHYKRVAAWNKTLTDAQLQGLTQQ